MLPAQPHPPVPDSGLPESNAALGAGAPATLLSQSHQPNYERLADGILCAALLKGNMEALGILYQRHAGLVYGIGIKVLGNAQAAEDLTQDIFLALVEPHAYNPERGSLRTYLAILTRSRALDRLRSKGAANRSLNRLQRLYTPIANDNDNSNGNTLEQVTGQEHSRTLKTALEQLPAEERQILMMMHFEGLSQSAIAQNLNRPLGTVKTRSRRGLIKLRQILLASSSATPDATLDVTP